jgi:hypothetical protein
MAFEGQQRVVFQHTAAVIDNADQSPPACLDVDAQAGGAGIQRVFEKFFDYRSRPFNDFPGGDLVGNYIREYADSTQVSSF